MEVALGKKAEWVNGGEGGKLSQNKTLKSFCKFDIQLYNRQQQQACNQFTNIIGLGWAGLGWAGRKQFPSNWALFVVVETFHTNTFCQNIVSDVVYISIDVISEVRTSNVGSAEVASKFESVLSFLSNFIIIMGRG